MTIPMHIAEKICKRLYDPQLLCLEDFAADFANFGKIEQRFIFFYLLVVVCSNTNQRRKGIVKINYKNFLNGHITSMQGPTQICLKTV